MLDQIILDKKSFKHHNYGIIISDNKERGEKIRFDWEEIEVKLQ